MVMIVSTAGIPGQERTTDIYGWADAFGDGHVDEEGVAREGGSEVRRLGGKRTRWQRAKDKRNKKLDAVLEKINKQRDKEAKAEEVKAANRAKPPEKHRTNQERRARFLKKLGGTDG